MNMNRNENKKQPPEAAPRNKKVWQNGLYAAVLAVAVLAVLILVNLVARALPGKFTEFDISNDAMFTLSNTSESLLGELDRDVTVYYLAQTGQEDANVVNLLNRYADASAHFSWQPRDPVLYPTFAQQFEGATTGSVVLTCGTQTKVLAYNDLYEMDLDAYYNDGSMDYNFQAENAITGALAQVTRTGAYVMYELAGHGETELEADFTDTLQNAGVTVQSLNLTTAGSIPADAAALLINAPTADITPAEEIQLTDYYNAGGRILLTTGITAETPNLDAVAAVAGLARQDGLIIETNTDNYPYGYPQTYLLPTLTSSEITAGVGNGMMVFVPIAQGLTYDRESVTTTYTALLTTSDTAYAMQNYATAETAQRAEDDPEGAFPVAVAAESIDGGGRLVWFGSPNVFVAATNQSVSGGNAQMLGSIANWFTGEQTTAVIDGKSMSAATLVVPSNAVVALGLLFTVALPLACLILGAVVCLVRRRR